MPRALCHACGAASNARRGEAPAGWSAERGQVRCAECTAAGRWAPPVTVRRLSSAERARGRAEAALRAHPMRADSWLGEDAGVRGEVVAELRAALERRGEIPAYERLIGRDGKWRRRHRPRLDREAILAAIAAHPERTSVEIAREVGASVSSVSRLRREVVG